MAYFSVIPAVLPPIYGVSGSLKTLVCDPGTRGDKMQKINQGCKDSGLLAYQHPGWNWKPFLLGSSQCSWHLWISYTFADSGIVMSKHLGLSYPGCVWYKDLGSQKLNSHQKSTEALELAHMKLTDVDKCRSKRREWSFIEGSWGKWEIKGETLKSERGWEKAPFQEGKSHGNVLGRSFNLYLQNLQKKFDKHWDNFYWDWSAF